MYNIGYTYLLYNMYLKNIYSTEEKSKKMNKSFILFLFLLNTTLKASFYSYQKRFKLKELLPTFF